MIRLRSLIACSGLSLGLLAMTAQAVPPVLERIPDDAMVAIAIPAPTQLEKNINALATAIDQQLPIPSAKDLLSMGGFTTGVDETKSMAIVILAPKKDAKADAKKADKPKNEAGEDIGDDDLEAFGAEEDRMIFLVPVTSYADLLKNFSATPAGEGKVDAIEMPSGEAGFARDLGGGYAAIGSKRETVEAFTGKPGANPVKSRMGKAGETLSDASDIVMLFNMDELRPMAQEGIKEAREAAKDQLSQFGQDGESQMALANWIGETVVRDTTFGVGGIKISASGVAFDMVGQFKPDSYLAKVFAAKGDSAALLSKLPVGPYLFAGAVDTSAAAMKQLMKDMTSKTSLPGGDEAAKITNAGIANAEGQAGVVGFPMGGALAGLLTATVQYTASKDPAATMADIKNSIKVMDGVTHNGVTFKTSFTEAGTKTAGGNEAAFDAWSVMMESDGSNQMATQSMAMIFGPQGGPAGYLAKTETGVYRTYAKNSDLMNNALKVGKGVEPLSTDKTLLGVQEQLPKGRMAEAYIGSKSVLDMVLPFAAMAGVPVPADKVPEKLPPIGMAVASDQGAARLTMFMPAQVIKTGAALGESFAEMQEDGMNGGEDAPGERPKNEGTGQPRF